MVPEGSSGQPKVLTFYFYTIADPDSLATGKGYQLWVEADASVTFQMESLTRVSLFKD